MRIANHKGIGKARKYLVEWEGDHEPTWEPPTYITLDLLREYFEAHPEAHPLAPKVASRPKQVASKPVAPKPVGSTQVAPTQVAPTPAQPAPQVPPVRTAIVKRSDCNGEDLCLTELRFHASEDSAGNGIFLSDGDEITIIDEVKSDDGNVFYRIKYGKKQGFMRAEHCHFP